MSFNQRDAIILVTMIDGIYQIMIIDDDGFETFECDNAAEARLAKLAWEDFLYGNEADIRKG
jgi:hypothetical protein